LHSDVAPILLADVWQQRHKPGSLDSRGDRVLAGGGTTALSTANNSALAIDHFLQQIQVFVIDIHRPWALPIDENRIFLTGAGASAGPFPGATAAAHWAWRHLKVVFEMGRMV
jgi:hypothetical protein